MHVSDLIKQKGLVHKLKSFGTVISFGRSFDSNEFSISILVFTDAGRPSTSAQLHMICGLLIGPLDHGAYYYTVSWSSHNSERLVRSIAAGKILAAGERIDEWFMPKQTYPLLHGSYIELIEVLDSKDLYTSLSTQLQSVDRYVRADVNYTRYRFEVENTV